MSHRLQIAVLISGGGTTLKNLIDQQLAGHLDVDFRLVISSHSNAGGLAHARAADIATVIVERNKSTTGEAFSQAIFQPCRDSSVDLVVMGGFLQHVLIPPDFTGKVINIHPSLIPAFCGRGYYGLRVHQAVLEYGAKVTGCTVHFVDNQYDHGPVIFQSPVLVQEDDTAETLAQRVFSAECEAYPEALRLIAARRVRLDGRIVRISDAS